MLRAIGLVVCHAAVAASQADNGIYKENGNAFGIVEANSVVGSSSQGVPGYTTYRLSLKLAGDAANVYTIFGRREGMSMSFPPAFQVPVPFGANVSRTLVLPKKICAR